MIISVIAGQVSANGPSATSLSIVNAHAYRDALLVITFCVVSVLLVIWPILRFLYRPWSFRKDLIFGAVSGDAAVYYFQQFRPGADILNKTPPAKSAQGEADSVYSNATQEAYFLAFKDDFFRWYGRRYYIAPVTMLLVLTGASACWAQRMLREWSAVGVGPGTTLRALSASALAGAFVWIISDEIEKLRKRDFVTSDVFYYVFRILIAVPFSWAIAAISVDGRPLGLFGSIPLAFFLGAFPTTTLFKIARRFTAQTLKLGENQTSGTLELEKLQSVGKSNAERFQDEGISTIVALAYTDPVDLTIRTNFDFSYVVDCVSQALAWMYFQDDCAKLIELSMRGAQEITAVVDWSSDATDAVKQDNAKQAILDAATKLNISEKALRTTFAQIIEDPYTEFLVKVWCVS
jgi:hypothetical protein